MGIFSKIKIVFNSIPVTTSTLLINYKKNLFKSLTNYSIINNFSVMYHYINLKQLDTGSLISTLPYSFYSIKVTENNQLNNYFLYFLRIFYFFIFFFFYFSSKYYRYCAI